MSVLLGIDPGNTESGWALIDTETFEPLHFAKSKNRDVLSVIEGNDFDAIAVEMVASYGMAVGRDVFETCVWIGMFAQHALLFRGLEARLVYRRDVKLHHCHTSAAKDSNITQALVDRFAHNQPNRGKGTKADPGWFYGFAGDIWQAYALAVYAAETAEVRF